MQRQNHAFAPSVTLVGVAVSIALIAGPAHAQLVNRSQGAVDDDAEEPDDEDILAPSSPKAASPAAPATAARALQVGLVPLVPLADAGKTTADQVGAELLKQLNDGQLFGAAMLAVDSGERGDAAAADAARQGRDGVATLARAQELLQKLQFGKARRGFELALEQLGRGVASLADASALAAAHVGLAEVAARQGQDDVADTQLALAAALNPELALDKKRFPPQFVRAFTAARDRVLKAGRGQIVVDASATGSTVQVDGRDVGPAPVTVSELPAGRHLVRALREGMAPWGALVEVAGGGTVTVSPGFIEMGGSSWLNDLQGNKLTPAAAKPVAAAARGKGLKAALVGVLSRSATSITVQLALVNAASGGLAKLPSITFQADLLDVSIETLKAREAVEARLGGDAPPGAFTQEPIEVMLEGARTAASAEMRTIAMRYEVKVARERAGSRLVGADRPVLDADADADSDTDTDDSATVLSAGKTGKRQRLDDEDDPYADASSRSVEPDPDAPVTAQPWFLPVAIGGGIAAVAVVGGLTVATLVAVKMLPDPRPADSGLVTVTLP